MTEIAKAYVQIVPTTQGIGSDLSSALGGEMESAGTQGGKKWSSGFSGAAKGAITAVGAGVAAATTAATALTKSAMASYADYEQFVGGIETLFGESADKVIADASEAFKTAGMSANDYMETSIQSAAAMINSLGGDTDKAAELMNMSITDMSDNVNKMGTNMQSVQDAYRGFSRGNFTMLDNLALGFAGTKEGMQQLLDKAHELSGVEYDIESYSDIVEAIHVVQTEMGITGTTAAEASSTIAGSVGAMKSAWQNLVTGLADGNADIEGLVNNLVATIVGENGEGGALGNILPAVQQALDGIITMVTTAAPQIVPIIVDLITDNLPQIIEAGMSILESLISGIIDALPELIDATIEIIFTIVEKLTDPDTITKLIEAAFKIIAALAKGLIEAIPKLVEAVPQIMLNLIQAILEFLPQLLESGIKLIWELAKGIVEGAVEVIKAIANLLGNIKDAIHEKIEEAKQWGSDMIQNFIGGITSKAQALWSTVKGIAGGIKSMLGFSEPETGPLSDFSTYAPDMMKLFAKGIRDNEHLITDQIGRSFNFGGSIVGGVSGSAIGSTNTYNISVNGIEELEELLRWFESRQVMARMA